MTLHVVQPWGSLLFLALSCLIQVVLIVDMPTKVPCSVMFCYVLLRSALSCPALALPCLAMLCYAFSCHCCRPCCRLCASALSFLSQYPFVSNCVLILRPLPILCRALTTTIEGESFTLKHCSNTLCVWQ